MTDNKFKRGHKITGPKGTVYVIPPAVKELNKHIKGDTSLEKGFMSLISTWTHTKETHSPPREGDMYKKIDRDLYRVKKSGTQARLLGYLKEDSFFVMKCLKKKTDRISAIDIKTANQRKADFDINKVQWEELWTNF